MTQDEAARHIGVSRPTFVQIEAGHRTVSSLELDRLAYLFGRDIRELVADAFVEEDALAALFRAQADVAGQPAVLEKLRECMAIGRELTSLEQLVGIDRELTSVPAHPLPPPKNRWEAIVQGERLADEERRRLGLGSSPAPELADLLESQGVRTGLVDLPDDVSGLALSDRRSGLIVVVNRAHHWLRRRFSFAHEYAHVVVDRDCFGTISRASSRDDLVEVRANAFAACFLLPENGVRQLVSGLGKGKPSRVHAEVFDEAGILSVEGRSKPGTQSLQLYDVIALAHHFAVSRPSALYRLRNLRFLTEAELAALKALDEAGKGNQLAELLGLPEPRRTEARSSLKHRILGLALEAFRRDEISRAKLRELVTMVGLSAKDFIRLVESAGIVEP